MLRNGYNLGEMGIDSIVDSQFFIWRPAKQDKGVWSKIGKKIKNLPAMGQRLYISRTVGKSFLYMFSDRTVLWKDYELKDYEKDRKKNNVTHKVYIEYAWPSLLPEENDEEVVRTKLEALLKETSTIENLVFIPFIDIKLGVEHVKKVMTLFESSPVVGFNFPILYHDNATVFSSPVAEKSVLLDETLQESLAYLCDKKLIFETVCHFDQLDEIHFIATKYPELTIILGNCGGIIGTGDYSKEAENVLYDWKLGMKNVSQCKNVYVKLCGILSPVSGVSVKSKASPKDIADKVHPYISYAVKVFGIDRCLFASNYPVEKAVVSYEKLVSAYETSLKAMSCSDEDITKIFSGNAIKLYNIQITEEIEEVKNETTKVE